MSLVLKEEEPVLVLAVHIHRHLDGAGVDLVRLVQAGELACGLEILCTDGAHVHKADRLFVASQLVANLKVALECFLHHAVFDLNIVEDRAKGGVAAVIRPIGVDHADLGDGGVAVLAAEVFLAELDVGEVHRQAALGDEGGKGGVIKLAEAVEHFNGLRVGVTLAQRLAQGKVGLAGLNGVDHVALDSGSRLIGKAAVEHIELCARNGRALALRNELYALGGGVGTLVKLAR